MPHHLEIARPGGGTNVMPMTGDTLVVGSGAGADVMVHVVGLDPLHLRFVRTDAGVRVEPVRPGASVVVNGEPLFCKDLVAGDVIEVAGLRLRWLPERAKAAPKAVAAVPVGASKVEVPPVRSAAVRRTRDPEPAPARVPKARQARRAPNWIPVAVVFGLVLVGGLVAVKMLSNSTWPSTPSHYVELARQQLQNNQRERALETLAFALRDATGPVREEALALQASVQQLQADFAVGAKIETARKEHDTVMAFAARYLRDAATRPAARELVRSCDQWLERHRAVCSSSSDGKELLRAIEEQRGRHTAIAGLPEPDTAADVVFAAQAKLRFQWRDYKGALRALDGFLAANPGDATATAERERLLREGEEWLAGKLRFVDQLLARGDLDGASRDLGQIETWCLLPQWESLVQPRRARIPAGR